ncbi:predicted protein [Sclerotinia sclerotiorum 1980 UF-70]|uniref:Uncharacterized protein n=1 Tax=Sclerotinia sclerotiorum (strain ATCC 18683 / 1980 / Ss-1) TaxID=665079 RepID=A7F539_SCLS1|nr:predicted protein [Sclerotinia sclerotiorum 1980 UF-70]EDN97860.1 predicted protein [Sclerotinia sclerotiorum 1980 UF-70]
MINCNMIITAKSIHTFRTCEFLDWDFVNDYFMPGFIDLYSFGIKDFIPDRFLFGQELCIEQIISN